MSQIQTAPRIARIMTILAWLLFLALVTGYFARLLDQRAKPNQDLSNSNDNTIVLYRNASGHYVAPGKINGQDVQFLIDTGASNVAIPSSVAKRLNLPSGSSGYASTANGFTKTISTRARQVSLGGIVVYDVAVSILPNAVGEQVLLGMAFLKHLKLVQFKGELTLSR